MILGFLPLSKGPRACRKSATACGSLSSDEDSAARLEQIISSCYSVRDATHRRDGLHPSSIRRLLHVRGVIVVLGKSIGRIGWCSDRIGGSDGDDRVCAGSSLV